LDEAVTYGGILNVCKRFALPISYVTTGQNVPDDIRVAAPRELCNLIAGGTEA
jgi:flagellar biosynthesis protein FlhF